MKDIEQRMQNGPCWFCRGDKCDAFSFQYDRPVHSQCVIQQLKLSPVDEDAYLIGKEILTSERTGAV